MSEYQYYEWQTMDRPLTDKEQAEVKKLSSHIAVGSTGAWVECSWGSFKHSAREVGGIAGNGQSSGYVTLWYIIAETNPKKLFEKVGIASCKGAKSAKSEQKRSESEPFSPLRDFVRLCGSA